MNLRFVPFTNLHLLLLGALAMICMSFPAAAQIRPAYTKNVDEPGRLPYQAALQFNAGSPECLTTSACILSFPAVPAGKRLVLKHLTLMVSANNGAPNQVTFGDTFTTNSGNIANVVPDFRPGQVVLGSTFWHLSTPVLVYYEPGAVPKLKVFLPGTLGVVSNASVHGYLIDAVN